MKSYDVTIDDYEIWPPTQFHEEAIDIQPYKYDSCEKLTVSWHSTAIGTKSRSLVHGAWIAKIQRKCDWIVARQMITYYLILLLLFYLERLQMCIRRLVRSVVRSIFRRVIPNTSRLRMQQGKGKNAIIYLDKTFTHAHSSIATTLCNHFFPSIVFGEIGIVGHAENIWTINAWINANEFTLFCIEKDNLYVCRQIELCVVYAVCVLFNLIQYPISNVDVEAHGTLIQCKTNLEHGKRMMNVWVICIPNRP